MRCHVFAAVDMENSRDIDTFRDCYRISPVCIGKRARMHRIPSVLRPFRLACALLLTLLAAPAMAHPHVMVVAKSAFVIEQGKLTGIRHAWAFDEAYSAFATSGMKKGSNGKVIDTELKDLAKLNVESLAEFKYFTVLKHGSRTLEFTGPKEGYYLEDTGKALVLHFVLPLKSAVTPASNMSLRVDDETYFVAFEFDEKAPASIEGKTGCTVDVKRPPPQKAGIPKLSEDFFSNMKSGFTEQFATTVKLVCP